MADDQSLELTPILPNLDSGYEKYLEKLEKYEDYVSFYGQLEEATTAFSWVKADMLLQMTNKLGDASLASLSKDLKLPQSTVVNYIRTARAFPTDQREPIVPFTSHFQASFADSYDEKTKTFNGEQRFKLLGEAADKMMSVRDIMKSVHEIKALNAPQDEETQKMGIDAEQRAHSLMAHFGVLRDKSKNGDKEAYETLVKEYQYIFPVTTS